MTARAAMVRGARKAVHHNTTMSSVAVPLSGIKLVRAEIERMWVYRPEDRVSQDLLVLADGKHYRTTRAVWNTVSRYLVSTMSLFIGPRMAKSSPFSFAGTLKVSKALTRSSTSAPKAASVTFMPLCVVFISRPE